MSSKPCMVADSLQVVDKILDTKRTSSRNNIAFFWAMLFLCLAGVIYLELNYGTMDWPVLEQYECVWYTVYFLMILLLVDGVYLLLRCFVSRLRTATLEITPEQQRLCGVSESETGFRIVSPTSTADPASTGLAPEYSQSGYTGHKLYCDRPSPAQRCMLLTTPSSMLPGSKLKSSFCGLSPQDIVVSPGSMLGGGSPSCASQQGSTSYMSSLLNSSYQGDINATAASFSSPMGRVSGLSSPIDRGSPTTSSVLSPGSTSPLNHRQQDLGGGNNALRARNLRRNASNKSSPVLRNDDLISNAQELDSYLQESMTAKDLRVKSGMSEARTSPAAGFSFWSFNRTMLDYIPVIGRYQYQLAPYSAPQSTTCVDNPQHDFSICPVSEDVWSKLDIDYDQVEQWVQNLRKWICLTILNRLIEEIAEVNKALVNNGSEDVQIGEVSLSTLKQWVLAKGQLVPKLSTLIPFLSLSANQEYLVQRIRELGSGGCMSAFKWNSGSSFKGKVWEENLPTDSAIVMHLLCCYMDLRLPSHPKYPDGKTFTCQHFLRAPARPNLKDRKDHLLIYEVRVHPPHYNVVIEDIVWNIKQGRNNMFHAILLFLHHIKTKEHGMLRRVSLGLSGVNILWVLDS